MITIVATDFCMKKQIKKDFISERVTCFLTDWASKEFMRNFLRGFTSEFIT